MKKSLSVACLSLGLLWPVSALTNDFDQFRQQQQQAFGQFTQDFDQAFAAYQQAFATAFAAYQEELRTQWREPLISDQHRWIEYSADQRSRSVVDFEANQVTIEVEPEAGQSGVEAAMALLIDVLERPVEEAYARDEVTQRAVQAAQLPQESLGASGRKRVLEGVGPEHAEAMLNQAQVQRTTQPAATGGTREVVMLTVPLPEARTSDRAREFMPLIERYAREYQLEPALMLAIMHSESSFNPMARSHIPAFGLMQIVPQSAGRDVSQELYGQQRVFSPSYLYNAENNIRAGAIYLNILNTRYLRHIEHPESRMYAVIAAYNTGAGNVARTFTGGPRSVPQAARVINAMPPQEVYQQLSRQLPYQETRDYLDKVTSRTLAYRQFN